MSNSVKGLMDNFNSKDDEVFTMELRNGEVTVEYKNTTMSDIMNMLATFMAVEARSMNELEYMLYTVGKEARDMKMNQGGDDGKH